MNFKNAPAKPHYSKDEKKKKREKLKLIFPKWKFSKPKNTKASKKKPIENFLKF